MNSYKLSSYLSIMICFCNIIIAPLSALYLSELKEWKILLLNLDIIGIHITLCAVHSFSLLVHFIGVLCCHSIGDVKLRGCLKPTMMYIFIGLSFVIVLTNVVMCTMCYHHGFDLEYYQHELYTSTRWMMKRYVNKAISTEIDDLQKTMECCGATKYQDWLRYGTEVPTSCCVSATNCDPRDSTGAAYHESGCVPVLNDDFSFSLRILGTFLAVSCLLEVMLLICLLYIQATIVDEDKKEEALED